LQPNIAHEIIMELQKAIKQKKVPF